MRELVFSACPENRKSAENKGGGGENSIEDQVENVKRDVAFVVTLVIQMVFPYIVSNF